MSFVDAPPLHEDRRAQDIALRAEARRFARAEIAPHAHAWDEANEFPRDLFTRSAAAGLLGVSYDEALGRLRR